MGLVYMYVCVFIVSFGAFLSATVTGWSSPMVEKLQELDDNPLDRKLTRGEVSWLSSLAILGSCSGCLIISLFGSTFGRKTLLLFHGCVVLIFYLMMAWSKTVWLLYIGRFMTGVGGGAIFSVLPMYYGELSEAKNRGLISTTMGICMSLGQLFSTAAGPYFSYLWFHLCLAGFALLFVVLLFIFTPESPYYLIKSDRSKAEAVLRKLRGNVNLKKTLDDMEESLSVNTETKPTFMEVIRTKGSIKALIMGIGGFTFMQFTGTSIVIMYTQTILKEAGGDFIPPEQGPIIIGVIQLITSVIFSLIVDRFPRKLLLSFSHIGISLSQIPMAIYFDLKRSDYEGLHSISWLPLVCLIVFSIMFSLGVGPILFTLLSELFPPNIKSVLISWMIGYNLGGSFLITLLFTTIEDAIGFDILLWFFAASGILAVIFINTCMIETNGKSLEEIQTQLDIQSD